MGLNTFNGYGWTANVTDTELVLERRCCDGSDTIRVNLLVEMPKGRDVSDLRILLTKNLNEDPVELTYCLNEFFTGSR